MSYWEDHVLKLEQEALKRIARVYLESPPCSMLVRHCLADSLEKTICTEIPQRRFAHPSFVGELVQNLLEMVNMLRNEDSTSCQQLQEAAQNFMEYRNRPDFIYNQMRSCMLAERDEVEEEKRQKEKEERTTNLWEKIQEASASCRRNVTVTKENLFTIEPKINKFNNSSMNSQCHSEILVTKEAAILTTIDKINESLMHIADKIQCNLDELAELQILVIGGVLANWKREQQLSGNGYPMNLDLNKIQDICELLADLVIETLYQINSLMKAMANIKEEKKNICFPTVANDDMCFTRRVDSLDTQAKTQLHQLIQTTFVVEIQPCQVFKIDANFSMKLRLLIGPILLEKMQVELPTVDFKLISKEGEIIDAKYTKDAKKKPMNFQEITTNKSYRQLSLEFKNVKVEKIDRGISSRGSVLEEKVCFKYQTQLKIGGWEVEVTTTSLPVVIVVHHSNQDPLATSTILWDNALGLPGRVPFEVPEEISWGQLSESLRYKYLQAVNEYLTAEQQNTYNLTDKQMRFLASKLFGSENLPQTKQELNAMMVSRSRFCRENMSQKNFSFWTWFFEITKLIKSCLQHHILNNCIEGFIDQTDAEQKLMNSAPGTFLLRFSNSELGGIVITYVAGHKLVKSLILEDLLVKDKKKKERVQYLARSLGEHAALLCLYPNVPKNVAFPLPLEEPKELRVGYVEQCSLVVIPSVVQMQIPSPHDLIEPPQCSNVVGDQNINSIPMEQDNVPYQFQGGFLPSPTEGYFDSQNYIWSPDSGFGAC